MGLSAAKWCSISEAVARSRQREGARTIWPLWLLFEDQRRMLGSVYMELEHTFMCPHCWQDITMLLDPSVEAQTFIQDCEVCCNPIEVTYQLRGGAVVDFDAHEIGQ